MYEGGAGCPLVTVYVLNHNYGRFLQQAVDSVLAQDYSELEIVVVDDASTDCSSHVLADLDRDPRLHIIRHERNMGLTASCNSAIQISAGVYVMRLDADDYLHPSAVSEMVAAISTDSSAVLVFPDYIEVDAKGAIIRRVKRHDFNALQAMSDLPAHGACTLVRRTFLEAAGGYDETVSCQDGLDMWLHVGDQHRVLHVASPLFYYRQHGHNLTGDESKLLRGRAKLIAKHVARRGLPRPRVVGMVPVRGQVADPRSMPLRRLAGRPLLEWSVDEALACEGIDHVIVSSPDCAILDHVVSRYGAAVGVHHRPAAWAGLNVELAATLADIVAAEAAAGRLYDAEMVLTVESPFRSRVFMQQAIDLMQLFGSDGVVGVRRDDEVFYRHDGLGLQPLQEDQRLRLERDDLFRECGGMRLIRSSTMSAPARLGHVLLDQRAAFNLRTELDWRTAETYAEIVDQGLLVG